MLLRHGGLRRRVPWLSLRHPQRLVEGNPDCPVLKMRAVDRRVEPSTSGLPTRPKAASQGRTTPPRHRQGRRVHEWLLASLGHLGDRPDAPPKPSSKPHCEPPLTCPRRPTPSTNCPTHPFAHWRPAETARTHLRRIPDLCPLPRRPALATISGHAPSSSKCRRRTRRQPPGHARGNGPD